MGQPGAVGQGLRRGWARGRPGRCAPATTGRRRSRCLAPQGVREEPAVGQQQHAGLQSVQQGLGQRGLGLGSSRRSRQRRSHACRTRPTPATRACGNAACSPLLTPGRPKNSVVDAACRRHQGRSRRSRPAADRPATPPASPVHPTGGPPARTSRANGCDPNRSRAWKIADLLGNWYCSCHPEAHASPSVSCASTSSYEPSEYRRHPDREISHHPRRQRPMPLLSPADLSDHLIDQGRRKHPGQHTHRHQIRQPTIRLRLPPTRTRHAHKLHPCSLN